MAWIDTLASVLIAVGSLVTLLVALVGAVRWVMRRELQPVLGEVHTLRDRIDLWLSEHQQRHEDERAAVAAAFEREGMYPPDGWRAPIRGGEGPQQ